MDGFHIRRPQSAKEAWVSASHACVSLQSWFRGTLQYVHQAGLPSFFPVRHTNYNENFEFLVIRLLDLPLGYNWWYIRSLGRKWLQHQTRGKILIKCCWTYFYNIFLYILVHQWLPGKFIIHIIHVSRMYIYKISISKERQNSLQSKTIWFDFCKRLRMEHCSYQLS